MKVRRTYEPEESGLLGHGVSLGLVIAGLRVSRGDSRDGDVEAAATHSRRPIRAGGQPLDLDVLRATLTKARGYAAKVKKPMFPPASVVQLVDIALRLIRELEARPRTVGDLTAHDLGRRVRIGGTDFELNGAGATLSLNGFSTMWPLDTPVEFLDDEPASAHQQPGERLPSHEQAAQVLEGDARAEDAQEGRP